jgi:NAD(P)-dependent dehydrogenase (short-subunit alcohol dehydrogenase family)
MRPLGEQVVLITSATQGLGRAVARALARAGATMLLHGRDPERSHQALEDIHAQTGNEKLDRHEADFSSLVEVRSMAYSHQQGW